ncbi:hypothetical protein F5B17DRAFT_109608 [Nemania serpens]|nr:hypothetical protein F5B17DRAFT_109608 [Nemania serpens]
MHRAILASLALVALVQAAPITEATKTTETSVGDLTTGTELPKPTFIILPPITGPIKPSDKRETLASDTDPTKAHITALELEYETLLQAFGNNGPKPIQDRQKAIKDELFKEYGITIIQSPDGTTTTFTPGKRDLIFPGGPLPGGPLIPDDPLPGGPITPENPIPGGPIEPSD